MTRSRLTNTALTGAVNIEGITRAHALNVGGGESLRTVPVGTLSRSPWQPRTAVVRDDEFFALADSITEHGVLEPLLGRALPDGRLELLAGERRLEAAKHAGLAVVPVRVLVGVSDTAAQAIALTENLARKDLTPWEEAHALGALRDARAAAGLPTGYRELASAAGRDRTTTGHLLTVADTLTPEVLAAARQACRTAVVRNPDSLPLTTLYGAAKAPTVADRVQTLALALEVPEPPPEGPTDTAIRLPRPTPAFTLTGPATAPRGFRLTRAVSTLTPDEATAALTALAPLLTALRRQAKGGPV